MEQMYGPPDKQQQSSQSDENEKQQSQSSASKPKPESPKKTPQTRPDTKVAQTSQALANSSSAKYLSTGGIITATLGSLLLGLAYVVRSLKNVKLNLWLSLKRDDRAEKKY